MNVEPTTRSVTLVWNTSSGWADSEKECEAVRSAIAAGGCSVDVARVERGIDIMEETRRLARSEVDVLVAAGGDGTVNAVASALVHRSTALGIIPAGTLNHFARDLHIPLDAEEAARGLTSSRERKIDVARVNGRVFTNNAVLGFFPEYREYRERFDARGFGSTRLGRFVATVAALSITLWRLPHLAISFEVDGRRRTMRTPFVLVGNNEHKMEGLALGGRERLDEGLLWVYVLRRRSRWQLFWLTVGLLTGRVPRESLFEVFATREIKIESRRAQIGIGIDGEMVRMRPPLEFESLPGALRVLAP